MKENCGEKFLHDSTGPVVVDGWHVVERSLHAAPH